MTTIEMILWLLQLIGAAVLACWIAYASTVVQTIKKFLWLHTDQVLPKWKNWFKPMGFIFAELRELLNCPYCISWWMGLFITLQYFTLLQAIPLAALTIIFVEIYRKISL